MCQRGAGCDNSGPYQAESSGMLDNVSYFERGGDHVAIHRQTTTDGVRLILSGDGGLRSYFFRQLASLLLFQTNLEARLVETGWSLAAFEREQNLDLTVDREPLRFHSA